jgi:hypothetical protein
LVEQPEKASNVFSSLGLVAIEEEIGLKDPVAG